MAATAAQTTDRVLVVLTFHGIRPEEAREVTNTARRLGLAPRRGVFVGTWQWSKRGAME